jgi:hypothetical protein
MRKNTVTCTHPPLGTGAWPVMQGSTTKRTATGTEMTYVLYVVTSATGLDAILLSLRQVRCVTTVFLSLWCVHFTCLFCIRDNLASHLRTHTGERPYKCTWIGCTYDCATSSPMRHICFPFSAVCSFHMFVLHLRRIDRTSSQAYRGETLQVRLEGMQVCFHYVRQLDRTSSHAYKGEAVQVRLAWMHL